MNTDYNKIRDYLEQKGYEGAELDKAATSTAAKVAAIQCGIGIVQITTHGSIRKGSLSPEVPLSTTMACAFGAAGLALRGEAKDELDPAFSWTKDVNVIHPVTGERVDLFSAVVDLNDNHKWPREHIAFWLRSIGC